MVLEASLKTAMLMVLEPTPRTEEAPPGPGSQILPTPGQTPVGAALEDSVSLADVAAAAVDESATYVPATIRVAMASGSADLRSSASPLRNILTPSPEQFSIVSFNQHADRSGDRAAEAREDVLNRSPGCWYPPEVAIISLPEPRVASPRLMTQARAAQLRTTQISACGDGPYTTHQHRI